MIRKGFYLLRLNSKINWTQLFYVTFSATLRYTANWFFFPLFWGLFRLIYSSDDLKPPQKMCSTITSSSPWYAHSVCSRDSLIIELDAELFSLQLSGCSSMLRLLLLLSHPFLPTSLRGISWNAILISSSSRVVAFSGWLVLVVLLKFFFLSVSFSLRQIHSAPYQIEQATYQIKQAGLKCRK